MRVQRSSSCFILIIIVSITLAACGGGGDYAAPSPPAPPASTVVTKIAALDNTQETTGSNSIVKGGGILGVDTSTGIASGFVVSTGVAGTVSHIHTGARGVAGGITVPLAGGPGIWVVPDGTTLGATSITDFRNGNFYFNIHSAAFPGGEIRGQIDLP